MTPLAHIGARLRVVAARLAGNALLADPAYRALHRQEQAARARHGRSAPFRRAKVARVHDMLRQALGRA